MAEVQQSKSVQNVYTFRNVYVDVGGTKYPVSSAMLQLAENTIPTLRLAIDPHVLTASTAEASSPQLAELATLNTRFANLAVALTKCTFNAEILKMDKLEQLVNLKDWILTGAGLSTVAATGSMGLELELQHPICMCQYSVLSIPFVSYLSKYTPAELAQSPNIVSCIFQILSTAAKINMVGNTTQSIAGDCGGGQSVAPKDALAFLKKQMAAASTAMYDNLEWAAADYSSAWPLSKCLASYIDKIKYSLVSYFNMGATNNLWELLARRITADWSTSIMPVLNGKLKMRPYSPWLKPTMKVYDEDITLIQMPGVDPDPITGVTVADVQYVNSTAFFDVQPSKYVGFTQAGVTYAPPALMSAPAGSFRGSIKQMELPGWLAAAQNAQAGSDTSSAMFANTGTPSNTGHGAKVTANPQASSDKSKSALWTGAAFAYAKACFYTFFRQGVQVGLKTRLMVQSAGGVVVNGSRYILPCSVCSVMSSPSTVVFDFYVTSVVHSFDCAAGTAGTEIAGMYARPSGGFKVMPDGSKNPLYI